ncbi:DUF72 domain-containing protein [Streptomyces sp. DSM 44917]|uniref:DUF72 domain-containing protein n=1 Tax=Streptomyces boetiae TaxID=3075541 RepID=A0ABU2LCJ6_9ACTN|nr:DUF72 domain-containing protein [Streptomyces sp. DSM 44917]MDT0309237.1 DUF72 domain-containing protein [Streptomyces sp. DSM 44917]
MGEILVGTCSWTDPSLVSSGWYPPGARTAEGRLRHYASRFPLVEADTTYYALPGAERSRQWAERTPPGFAFDVKAHALMTGHPAAARGLPGGLRPAGGGERRVALRDLGPGGEAAVWRAFLGGVGPLREAGKLGAVLLQFPPWFGPGGGGAARLARCRELAGGAPLAVEFRNAGWLTGGELGRTTGLLRELGMALVAVDTAQGMPTSVPPVAEATCGELAVVRLHGRSPAWGSGSKEDRFRHRYSPAELAPWAARARRLAERAARVHVLVNTCCADAAVRAAGLMADLLPEAVPAPARPAG